MNIVKNIILGCIGAYATFQIVNVAIAGQSAVHQIYGAVLLVVATLCVGFMRGGK
jgi:hypothetical protein